MRKIIFPVLVSLLILSACARATVKTAATPTHAAAATIAPTHTPLPSATATETPVPVTATPTSSPTTAYPVAGRGPSGFASGVDPLTGLEVKDPNLLNRRPIVIKVENIPREHRPQWGLSLADLVFEYYTEFGATRFAAVFYGNDAQQVGPIRSGRFFDTNVVQMYKAIFVYGSAYQAVQQRFFNSDFAKRLILETNQSCPALCRYDPTGQDLLVANTVAMQDYVKSRGVDNSVQNLDGMLFKQPAPANATSSANQVYVRYSGAIYNRWDYDPTSGRYLRFADKENDVNRNHEVYAQLTDRLTGNPIAVENVVTLCVPHQYFVKRTDAEVLDIIMNPGTPSYKGCDGKTYKGGSGVAYVARDGQMFTVTWQRSKLDSVVTLVNADGSLFPFKPGQTWFEVIGASSTVASKDGAWHFVHQMAP
ncbi:MAG TPA: DUF3048 domain-containing protein [Anaerolineaceae bacterium]